MKNKDDSPPREDGWLRHQENFGEAHLRAADGVVTHKSHFGVNDHPVCGANVGFAEIFLMPQPPLLTRRGFKFRE